MKTTTDGSAVVFVPRAVCLGAGIPYEHQTATVARSLGAENIRSDQRPGNEGQFIADWPQFYWTLATEIEAHWPEGQLMYQTWDKVALRAAVALAQAGMTTDAMILARGHKGCPAAEMPGMILEQVQLVTP